MKYFSLDTVANAYQANSTKTKNKFWGLLSILSSLNTVVRPGISYDFSTSKVSDFLESLFCLDNAKKNYPGGSTWNIMLSSKWTTKVPEQMLSKTPNVYDIIAWYFRTQPFNDSIDNAKLLEMFLQKCNISLEDAKALFDMTGKTLAYSSSLYNEADLLKKLKITGKNITAEGNSVVASPGELSRAPFIKTLYAGQSTLECLIITPFKFSDLYAGGGTPAKKIKARQTIYFGTPGSGKSFEVKSLVKTNDKHTFRTIFHPDSDYSTFVGSYKPVTKSNIFFATGPRTLDELADILKDAYKNASNANSAVMQFGIEYSNYFNGRIASYSKQTVVSKAIPGTTYDKELQKAVNLAPWIEKHCTTSDISYEFVPQAFTDAYVDAWQNPTEDVYLVIEEINRGNCAQVFGDLFQLLDRDDKGVSEYAVTADKDLYKYLSSKDVLGPNHDGIKDGKLILPSNLFIIATMNTSDQSLFPMDSAFKRRWNWVYVPIEPENPKSQFIITIDNKKYDWSKFLVAANERIKDVSESEDKQMGNFFIKEDIDKDEFICKVMFYLWSEVCKDEYHARSFFHYKDGNNDEFSFNELFQKDAAGVKKDVALLQGFMSFLGVPEK